MKIGIMPSGFRLPLAEGIRKAAECGAEGVQVNVLQKPLKMYAWPDKEIDAVAAECRELGLEISAICGDVGGHALQINEQNMERARELCLTIDLALKLGTRVVTSHIGVIPEDPADPTRLNMYHALREVALYAAPRGVTMAIETGPDRGARLREFLDELSQPGIGVNLDPGNMAMITGEDPCVSAAALAPYVRHTHLKDGCKYCECDPEKVYAAFASGGIKQLFAEHGAAFMERPIGSGDVDWPRYLAKLRELGLDRYPAVIEREVSPRSVVETREAVKFLRRLIG